MSLDISAAQIKIDQAVAHLADELKKLRTGRANAAMLENIKVTVYGSDMPLPHIATISVADAQLLQISPFDPNNLNAISAAIREDQSLGLNPADDGKVIRVPIPPMTTERRQEVVKLIKEKVEEANIALRNIRHEVLNTAKAQVKDSEISEDDYKSIEKRMEDLMTSAKTTLDEHAKAKETEVMTV